MNGSTVNSSSSASSSDYYWIECETDDDGTLAAGFLILLITDIFEFLVGAPANLWLVRHILRQRSKVTSVLPADIFPLHLALTQLLFYLFIPVFFANHFLWQSQLLMTAMTPLTSMVLVMKPLLLCLVCVENYMAVVRPLDYLRFKAHQYRWGCLGVSWCIYVLLASTDVVQRSSLTVNMLLLPILIVDTFCSLSVLKTLQKPPPGDESRAEKKKKKKKKVETKGKQEQSSRKEGQKEQDGVRRVERGEQRAKRDMNSMKRKAFITITIIQAVLTLNYLPHIVTLPMDGLVPARTLKCQIRAMTTAAASSVSYLQPLLYLHRLGRLPCLTSRHA